MKKVHGNEIFGSSVVGRFLFMMIGPVNESGEGKIHVVMMKNDSKKFENDQITINASL